MKWAWHSVVATLLAAASLAVARPASSQGVSAQSPGWRNLAPNVQVKFVQTSSTSCTWYFLNSDPNRTLQALRFSYTLAKIPMGRGPLRNPTAQDYQDEIPGSLNSLEVVGGESYFRATAPCVNVDMKVVNAQWSKV